MNTRTLLALALCAALTACEKDDDDDEPFNTPPTPVMRTVVWEIDVAGPYHYEANWNSGSGSIAYRPQNGDTTFTHQVVPGSLVTLTVYRNGGVSARILCDGVLVDNCTQVGPGVHDASGYVP